jgi:para-aminobenzoate synthetase component I
MAIIKSAFEKRPIMEGESPQAFFEHVRGKYSFLLESSATYGGSGVGASGKGGSGAGAGQKSGSGEGRYSFLGWDPFMVLYCEKGVVHMEKLKDFSDFRKSTVRQMVDGNPLKVLSDIFTRMRFTGDLPFPFCGGAAGFLSYDYGCFFNGVSQQVFDDLEVPDFCLLFTDKLVAFDHEKGEVYLAAFAETEAAAGRKIAEMKVDLKKTPSIRGKGAIGKIESNLSAKSYREKIAKVKEYLTEGQTYQVNLSQRFAAECSFDGWAMYKALSKKSPAPFACYFDMDDYEIISSSPELLLRKRDEKLETWPIKGTVARGGTAREDSRSEKRLLSSKKDDAELSMIVDLARNDLGKVSEPGSVVVEGHREIMKLSHVIHTFSRVSGKMARGKDLFDAIGAVFPGGSITGCPKKRTMEIIDRLEDFRRGIYTGSAGYISFTGDADLNILIRSMLLKDGKIYFQAGGGIVIDSDAKGEYEETMNKVRAIFETLCKD